MYQYHKSFDIRRNKMQSLGENNEKITYDESRTMMRSNTATSEDDSTNSRHDESTSERTSSYDNRNGSNDDEQPLERRVKFSEMPDQVYFFQEIPRRDYPLLWYGCHELQRLLDESRVEDKMPNETK